jgi:CPA2 family monovalent cation:H+ antiporter-2
MSNATAPDMTATLSSVLPEAAHSATSNLQEILILLFAAIITVTFFRRLHLSPVLGYLVAGGIIGPHGLSYIPDVENTRHIAEFGVVFLLFAIGLELTIGRLMAMRRHVFGFGTLQMLSTGMFIGTIAYMLGTPIEAAIVIGGGLALSSTAIVLQVLGERGEMSTQSGRLSIATLILQDLAVVPLLIMVPLFAAQDSEGGNTLALVFDAVWKAFFAMIAIFIFGAKFLRPLFQTISALRSQELFIATTLLVVLGTSYATEYAGLSLALGAFVAGLLVAETEFRPQVEADIEPFKGLLMGLFFMSVGMSINFTLLMDQLGTILALTALMILGKGAIMFSLARLFGFRRSCSIEAGLYLSQGSEFAFVLFGLAVMQGVLADDVSQLLLVVVSISMAVTPLLVDWGKTLLKKTQNEDPTSIEADQIQQETADLEDHIIIIGFGRVGTTTAKLLQSKGLNTIAIDDNTRNVHRGRKHGFPVYFGNAARIDILRAIGIERSRLVAITIDSKLAARKTADIIHKEFPNLPIVARAKDRMHAEEMRDAGATVVLAELFESSLLLGDSILRTIGTPDHEIELAIDIFRQAEYPPSQNRNS